MILFLKKNYYKNIFASYLRKIKINSENSKIKQSLKRNIFLYIKKIFE